MGKVPLPGLSPAPWRSAGGGSKICQLAQLLLPLLLPLQEEGRQLGGGGGRPMVREHEGRLPGQAHKGEGAEWIRRRPATVNVSHLARVEDVDPATGAGGQHRQLGQGLAEEQAPHRSLEQELG
jgi:hypothetical protein